MSRTVALVPAAGAGRRLGIGKAKPFRCLGQRPLIGYALESLDRCPEIDSIVIIVSAKEQEYCRQEIIPACNLHKPWQLVVGGVQRQESVYNGLKILHGLADTVVVHDAARPLISVQLLQQCILEAQKCGACIVGVPVRDTLKKVGQRDIIDKTIPRSHLWMAQTPQGFHYDLLWNAHQKALQENFQGTDDSVLVECLGSKVKMIRGSYKNIKITYPEDLLLVESWLLEGKTEEKI